ncbi:C39 family peptidase [Deinococcus aquatilis]|uniref:C39 family peptidase n=1 Tax=Deinococcus aquatilis TaxID=519440 RepID=UPI0012FCE374|nr:C39 family peptidase [Deinococcus aquatilis]
MPLVHQTYNACGPASLLQVLRYYGLGSTLTLADVSRATRPNDRAYMTSAAIVTFAPSAGLQAKLYSFGSLETVRRAIRARLPLIALQNHYAASGAVIPHWRVIVGYDDARQVVYLMDPLLGYVTITYPDFERVWREQRGQFAVLFPPSWIKIVTQTIG